MLVPGTDSNPRKCVVSKARPKPPAQPTSYIVLRGLRFRDPNGDGIATLAEQEQDSSFTAADKKAFLLLAGLGHPCHNQVVDRTDIIIAQNSPKILAQLIRNEPLVHLSRQKMTFYRSNSRFSRLVAYEQMAYNLIYHRKPLGRPLRIDGVFGRNTANTTARFRAHLGKSFTNPNNDIDGTILKYILLYLEFDASVETSMLVEQARRGKVPEVPIAKLPPDIKTKLVQSLRHQYPEEVSIEGKATSTQVVKQASQAFQKHFGGSRVTTMRLHTLHMKIVEKQFKMNRGET